MPTLGLTNEAFIEKAKQKHGLKYDYTKTKYIGALKSVVITCQIHGDFEMSASNHLAGRGCPQCGLVVAKKKLTRSNEKFINDCKEIFGNKYTYEHTYYTHSKSKVTITCPIHGDFSIFPSQIYGHHQGCVKCEKDKRTKENGEKFIAKAKIIHKGKYTYDKVNYKDNATKVEIICPIHGSFFMKPNTHLLGSGCPQCWEERRGSYLLSNTKEFIKKAKTKHDDLYIYDLVNYKTEHIPVKIICRLHGVFEQTPHSHLAGAGCPMCKKSKGELKIHSFLKQNKISFKEQKSIKNDLMFCDTSKFVVDFFLPNHNTIIEFHGEQHYKPIKHFGGIKKFEKQQNRDIFLRKYCKYHKIKLIEIPYWDFDNIETILKKKLKIKRK